MLSKLKNTIKHSSIYSLGNLSAKLIGFLLLPIYLHYLSIGEYGIFTLLEVTGQILSEILHISIPVAMIRWCSLIDDPKKQKSIIFTSLLFIISAALLNSIIFIPLSSVFSNILFSSSKYSEHFSILFLFVSLSLINKLVLNIIRLRQKSIFFVLLTLARFTTILVLNIYFVAVLELGIKGILLGLLLGQFLIIILSIKFIWNNIVFKLDFSTLKEMLGYGIPLVFSTISYMILNLGDRYLIKFFLGNSAVGIYSAGYKIASLINIFINQPFQMGYLPIAFEQAKQENYQRFFAKILTYKTLLLSFVVILLSFFGGQFIYLITTKTDYYKAIPLIPVIAMTFLFKGIQYVLSLSFHIINKTFYNAIIVVFGSIINIGFNVLLIPHLGIIGAPLSMIFSLLIMIIITYYYSQKEYYLPFELKKILLLIMCVFIYYFISQELSSLNTLYYFFIAILGLILLPILLYLSNFFEEIELLRIKQTWIKWRNPRNWSKHIKKIDI